MKFQVFVPQSFSHVIVSILSRALILLIHFITGKFTRIGRLLYLGAIIETREENGCGI